MPRYLLIVDYRPGDVPEPMDRWKPEEVRAHMDYYAALNRELTESGELIGSEALTTPDQAVEVISDGRSPAIVTDGPYAEFKETFAGYQLVDVESQERALEIAARVSAVPGPGGVPLRQPIVVRRAMSSSDFDAVRAHLHERAGEAAEAARLYAAAAGRATSLPERRYLTTRAARPR